jgi:hypothetical protein
MRLRERLAVAALFGMGLIVTAAGIVRTWFIYRSLFNEYDQTWYSYPLWIAAAIEIDLGVVSCRARLLISDTMLTSNRYVLPHQY